MVVPTLGAAMTINTHGCWKNVKQLLYSPKNLIRRILEYMRLRRDVWLIILGLLAAVLITVGPDLSQSIIEHHTTNEIILNVAVNVGFVVIVLLLMWLFLKDLRKMDAKIEQDGKKEAAKKEQEITNIVNQAIEKAIEKQTQAIISAMREPLDGHE